MFLKHFSRKNNTTVKAEGKQTADGFVVLKGSKIEDSTAEYLSNPLKERRKNAVIINGTLQNNEFFTSPSCASSFVIGQASNGLIAWKTKEGITLKEYENK